MKFLPFNTTPLIQPMVQQVIPNFKEIYTIALFQRAFEVTSDTKLTLREFWRNHFNWRKLWPECVLKKDFKGCKADPDDRMPVVEFIVSLGKSMGLDVSGQDVEELVDDHREVLTTEELQNLQLEQQQMAAEEIASEEEERGENVPSLVIKDMCAKWRS